MEKVKKKTKIVATVSDASCTSAFIKDLYAAGMDVVRLNTAHQDLDNAKKVITIVRSVSDKIPILIDTKGPEIRTIIKGEHAVKTNEVITISGNAKVPADIHVTYPYFVADVSVGHSILIDDGDISLIVKRKYKGAVSCIVQNDGIIKNKKSVNVRGATLHLPSLSEKDKKFISFAAQQQVTFIAHSFVRNKHDVLAVQKILNAHKSPIKIIAKIENKEGIDNLDEILDYAYGIMIARGDLGVEIPAEQLPPLQKAIIKKCIDRKKPVIVATQMLHSMIQHPRPTRAEVSDVANAIYDGTDAIMLSGETAYGTYPIAAVETMTKIAMEVESHHVILRPLPQVPSNNEIVTTLARSAIIASCDLNTHAIILDTLSGKTARYLASFRGTNIIYAQCYTPQVMRELALSYGIYADCIPPRKTTDGFVHKVLPSLIRKKWIGPHDLIIIVAGSFGYCHGASFMEITTAENMLKGPLRCIV
jgi:pyruvate kinase